MFYLSAYLEEHRDEYYSCLQNISKEGDWNGWIKFFLGAVEKQSQDNSQKVKNIMQLYEKTKQEVHDITHSQFTVFIVDALFNKPIFKSTDLVKQLHNDYGVHDKTSRSFIRQLKNAGILSEKEPSRGSKAATLWFPALLKVTEG